MLCFYSMIKVWDICFIGDGCLVGVFVGYIEGFIYIDFK